MPNLDLNQVENYLELLPDCFRGTNVEDLLRVWLERVARMELTLIAWESLLWDIDAAFGAHLDRIGEIVGQPRLGYTDAQYRPWIRARQLVNRSHATRDEILKIISVLGQSAEFSDHEARLEIRIQLASLTVDPRTMYQILSLAKAAGVRLDLTYSTVPLLNTFTFGGVSSQGFGNGALAGVLTASTI